MASCAGTHIHFAEMKEGELQLSQMGTILPAQNTNITAQTKECGKQDLVDNCTKSPSEMCLLFKTAL